MTGTACLRRPSCAPPRQIDPAGPDRSHQPVLAADQVLAVPAARSRHARRVSRPGRRGRDRRRARRAAATSTTVRISSSSRSTSPTPTAPTGSRITTARAALRRARRPARDVAARRGRGARRRDLPRSRASRRFPRSSTTSAPAAPRSATFDIGPHARSRAADPARPDQAPPLPRPQLDRRHPRLPAALRLLLQGRVFRGRPVVLHAARRRRAGRDRPAARPSPLLPRRSPARRSPVRRGAVRRHARHEPAVPGRGDRRFDPARRSHRARGRRRPAQHLRRLRDADARQPRAQQQAPESRPGLRAVTDACTASAS